MHGVTGSSHNRHICQSWHDSCKKPQLWRKYGKFPTPLLIVVVTHTPLVMVVGGLIPLLIVVDAWTIPTTKKTPTATPTVTGSQLSRSAENKVRIMLMRG